MKIKLLLAMLITITILACDNNTTNKKTQNKDQESISFNKKLELQGTTFQIYSFINSYDKKLTIEFKGLENGDQKVEHIITGSILNAEVEDLNSDGYPELCIYISEDGSGSYGSVIAYSSNNGKSMSQVYLPEISENKDLSNGYMGHDEFTLVENYLVRRFPIYNEGDANSEPSGGHRQIQYKMVDGEASRIFKVVDVSTFNE
jgi:hypothetical protein